MKIEVTLPDNVAELVKNIAALIKEDPETYCSKFVEESNIQLLKSDLHSSESAIYGLDFDKIMEKYGLKP